MTRLGSIALIAMIATPISAQNLDRACIVTLDPYVGEFGHISYADGRSVTANAITFRDRTNISIALYENPILDQTREAVLAALLEMPETDESCAYSEILITLVAGFDDGTEERRSTTCYDTPLDLVFAIREEIFVNNPQEPVWLESIDVTGAFETVEQFCAVGQ